MYVIDFAFTLLHTYRQLSFEAQQAMDNSLLLSFMFKRWQVVKQRKQMQRKSLAKALLSIDVRRNDENYDVNEHEHRNMGVVIPQKTVHEPLLMSLATAIHMIDPTDTFLIDFPTLIGTALQRTQDSHVKKISPKLVWNQGLFLKMRVLSSSSFHTGGFWDEEDSVVVNIMRSMLSNDNHDGEHGMIGLWENDEVDCQYDFHSVNKKPLRRPVSMCVVEGYGHDADSIYYYHQGEDSDAILLLISINDAMKKFREDYEKTTNDEELFSMFLQQHVAKLIQDTLWDVECNAYECPIVAVYTHEVYSEDVDTVQSQFYPIQETCFDGRNNDSEIDVITNAILCIAGSFHVQNSFMFDVSCPISLSKFTCLVSPRENNTTLHNLQTERCRQSFLEQITSVLSVLVLATSTLTPPLPLIQRLNVADHVNELLHEHIWASDLSVNGSNHENSVEQIKQRSCRHRMMDEIDVVIGKMRQSLYHFQPFPSSSFALTTTDGELVVFGALYDDQSGGIYGANCVHAEWWKDLQYKQKHECLITQLNTLRDKIEGMEIYPSNTSWRRSLSSDVNEMIDVQFKDYSALEKLIYVYHDIDLGELDNVDKSSESMTQVYIHASSRNQHQTSHVANLIEGSSFSSLKGNKRIRDNDEASSTDGDSDHVRKEKENILTSSNDRLNAYGEDDSNDIHYDNCDSDKHVKKRERSSQFAEEKEAYLEFEKLLSNVLHSEQPHTLISESMDERNNENRSEYENVQLKDLDLAKRCRLERERFEEIMMKIL